ncbi:MAG: hypothetical protein OEY97_00430 [Nitrospirota bacterium]|nr:hypothetical protein [Nitrospirota bacterium]
MNGWITLLAVVMLGTGAPAAAGEPQWLLADGELQEEAAQTGDMDRDRLRERSYDAERIAERLGKEAGMTARQEIRLQNRIQQHLALGGNEENLKTMTQTALNEGCRGDCLNETVRYMNQAMHLERYDATAAREMVTEELRHAAREGDAAGLTERFERRMEARIGPPPRLGGPDRDMDMERGRDRDGGDWDGGRGPGGRR